MTTHLPTEIEALLQKAHESTNGLATLMGAHSRSLRQVIAALRADAVLPDHPNPGDATLQVLRGDVELGCSSGTNALRLTEGDLEVIPLEKHYLKAFSDSVVIITQRVDER